MIDLHSHVLPNVDDGPASIHETIEMLQLAAGLGIHTLAATPHLEGPLSTAYAARVDEEFYQVERHAREVGITLLRGFEVRLAPDLPARLHGGEPSTLHNSRAVLVDLPFIDWPHFVEEVLFQLQLAGYNPILAHPERYPRVQREPDLICRLAERGIALQIDLPSLVGTFGRRAKRTAETLLDRGAIHLVATDAHSAGHRMAAVPAALRRLQDLAGEDALRLLTVDNPSALLANRVPLCPLPARRRSSHGPMGRWLHGILGDRR